MGNTGYKKLFMVLFLHQTTTEMIGAVQRGSCLWSYSYIKPQLWSNKSILTASCLWSYSYIKPQLYVQGMYCVLCCLWSYSYIKPQPNERIVQLGVVVYGPIPTSNHNYPGGGVETWRVVYGPIPTSNHNLSFLFRLALSLFMVLFLHQTTTTYKNTVLWLKLFMVLFLHQTTTLLFSTRSFLWLFMVLFLHQTTTSWIRENNFRMLFMVLFLHQTTTVECFSSEFHGCLWSYSYIKPQPVSLMI